MLAGLRPGGRGGRGRREEDPRPAADHAQARRSRRAAHPVPQQDRQDGGRRARHAEDAAAGERARRCCCARSRCARTASTVGSIDLALERAYIWRDFAESEIAEIPGDEKAREIEARFSMLETLADHDDLLMEQLLEEMEPPRDEVFDDLAADLRDGSVIAGADRHGREGQRRAAAAEGDPPRRAGRRGDAQAARRRRTTRRPSSR